MRWPEDIACRDVVEVVSDYLDGGLAPDLREGLEMHLVICDGCDSYVDQMRKTILISGRLGETPLPESLEARLIEAFRAGGQA
jgi:anti-sigma factor RsiW